MVQCAWGRGVTRVLNGPENYNLPRPGLWFFKPESNAARHTSINCLPEPNPRAPALFSSYTCYRNFTQRCHVCVCPSAWSSSQTYSSPRVNSNDSQQTIFNLQPARNVFYKKGSPGPHWPGSFANIFGPNPAWTCGAVGFVRPGLPIENSRFNGSEPKTSVQRT